MAVTDVERLAVLIEANTKSYERAMKNVERKTNQAMGKATRSVRSLDAQMKTAAISARNFMGMFGVTIGIAGISRLLDDLDALGKAAARTGIDVESLQEIMHQADLAGVSTSDMERGLQRFNEEIGKAASGTTELSRLFEANNVSIRDANGNLRGTRELYHEIANLVANAASHQEAARIAQMAMGRSGRDLVPHLQQGAAALREGEQAARDAGVVIDRDIIAKAEAFNDAWATAWRGFRAGAFDVVTDVVGFFDDLDARIRQLGRDLGLNIFEGAGGTGRKPLEITVTNPGGTAAPQTIVPTKPGKTTAGGGKSEIDRQREALDQLLASQRLELAMLRELDPVQKEMIRNSETLAVATTAERHEFENLTRIMHDLEAAQESAAQMMDFFGNAAMNALDGLINRGDSAKDMLANLTRMLAQAALQASLLGSGPLAGLFGTVNPAGGTGGLFGSFAGTFAAGGHIPRGQFGLVGERGPELISGPANVTPTSKAGGMTMQVTIDARGAERGVEAKIGQALEQFRRGLPRMVQDAQSRGRIA